jgi:SAM-dependent methyltransferase
MGDGWYRQAFGAHYRLLYRHRDQEEARRCLELLPTLAPLCGDGSERPVLDLGCGDGRHLDRLRRAGVPAVGLDLSWDLLTAARDNADGGEPLRLVRGDMRELPLRAESVAAVLSLFTAFGYFAEAGANEAVVREIARVLTRQGHWFLDFFDTAKVRRELADGLPRRRERCEGPLLIREERRIGGTGDSVTKKVRLSAVGGQEREAAAWGIGDAGLEYEESVALLDLGELDAMARRNGMIRVAAAGDYDGRPLHEGSRWILVYRRRGESGS